MYLLILLVFFFIVLCSMTFFGGSLVAYRTAKMEYEQTPSSESQVELSSRKVQLTVASVIMGVFLAMVLSLVVLFFFGIAYM